MSQTFSYQPKLARFAKYNYPSDALKSQIHQIITHERLQILYGKSKAEREEIFAGWRDELRAFLDAKLADDTLENKEEYTWERCWMSMEILVREYFRELIIDQKVRIDGRKLDEIRALYAEIGMLDQVHGV
ncbi:hypothetical protein KBB05_00875 [Patescibacteria group bacterium]|nr:hypothetical protein [Patescibacteria group bacterium]